MKFSDKLRNFNGDMISLNAPICKFRGSRYLSPNNIYHNGLVWQRDLLLSICLLASKWNNIDQGYHMELIYNYSSQLSQLILPWILKVLTCLKSIFVGLKYFKIYTLYHCKENYYNTKMWRTAGQQTKPAIWWIFVKYYFQIIRNVTHVPYRNDSLDVSRSFRGIKTLKPFNYQMHRDI